MAVSPSVVGSLLPPRRWRMLAITLAWGACFLAIRWGLRDAPLLWFAALRALIAGAALLALGAYQRRPNPRSRGDWLLIGALGLVNVTIGFAAMFAGTVGLVTGAAAVLANAQPLLIVLPAWWLYGERIGPRTATALLIAFGGLFLVAAPGRGGSGALLSLVAAAAITAGTLLARKLKNLDVILASGWHFVIGGVVLAIAAAIVEGSPRIDWSWRFVVALLFLSLVGSAFAFVLWFLETQRSPLAQLTSWTFLAPVFGVLLGFVVLGERPSVWMFGGLILVLVGLVLAQTGTHTTGGSVPASIAEGVSPAQQ